MKRSRPDFWRAVGTGLAALLAVACGGREASEAPNARREIVEMLRADVKAARHPSDGGGHAFLESVEGKVVAGGRARFAFVYEAGPLGVDEGGSVFLQVSPFWGWSAPQTLDPGAPGFTTVSGPADLRLEPATVDRQLFEIRIAGRPLRAGERLRIVYGAGLAAAEVDRFAERGSSIWFAVDGDGDGVRALVPDPPTVDVLAGPPARIALTLPTTSRPGEGVRLHLAVLDALGSAGVSFAGELELEASDGLRLPRRVKLGPRDEGGTTLEGTALAEGVQHVEAHAAGGLYGRSNALVVEKHGARVLWGDLHGHSQLSDGTGTPEDYFRYARDVAGLDVVALTDHDHWGLQPLAHTPELWQRIRAAVMAFHVPGRFVTLLGFEWTNWIHGHRHVLYFRDEGRVLDSVQPAYESPLQLWAALAGEPALTFAHHSAGGPIATNWAIPPDPVLEPVTEIVSVHGSSEASDTPKPIYDAVPGNTVRDALARGYRLGFVGSGDGHDGHPGLAGLASPSAGLAGILAESATRDAVLEALRARRVYATNGPRILMRASLGGRAMGAVFEPSRVDETLEVRVVAEAPLERVDIVRGGRVAESLACAGLSDFSFTRTVARLRAGDYLYVRAVQKDGGAAWSSPFFAR